MKLSGVALEAYGEPVTETMARREAGIFDRIARSTDVMRWQCGHQVANISSRYGVPANDEDEIGPKALWTLHCGAALPVAAIDGMLADGCGATAAPGTTCLLPHTAYAMMAASATTPTTADKRFAVLPPPASATAG